MRRLFFSFLENIQNRDLLALDIILSDNNIAARNLDVTRILSHATRYCPYAGRSIATFRDHFDRERRP